MTNLTPIEEKLAHQERLISDLNDVLLEFTQRVMSLEGLVKELRETNGFEFGPQNEKPPHY